MSIATDFKFSCRLLRKNLSTTIMGMVVISVGIGVSATMFAFVNGTLWSEIDIPKSDQLVSISWSEGSGGRSGQLKIDGRDYKAIENNVEGLERIATYREFSPTIHQEIGETHAERYRGVRVSPGFFGIASKQPILGSIPDWGSQSAAASQSLVISHKAWEEQFSSSKTVIGESVQVDGIPYEVAGVMPEGFNFPMSTNVWIRENWVNDSSIPRMEIPNFSVIGIMKQGLTMEKLEAELAGKTSSLTREILDTNSSPLVPVVKVFSQSMLNRFFIATLTMLLILGLLVLAVACINVFNIILARTANRMFELTLRSSLGSTRSSIVRQVLLDGFLISISGAGIGMLIAYISSSLLWSWITSLSFARPYWWHIALDERTLAFIVAAVVLCSLGSSIIPALRASRTNSYNTLKASDQRSTGSFVGSLSRFLVGAQITVSFCLLVVGTLLVIPLKEATGVDLPINADEILIAPLNLEQNKSFVTPEQILGFFEKLEDKIEAVPGVEKAYLASPRNGMFSEKNYHFQEFGTEYADEQSMPMAGLSVVSQDAFDTLGLKSISGRTFNSLDTVNTQKICVLSYAVVERDFGNESPIGKRISVKNSFLNTDEWLTIVGVVSKQNAGYHLIDWSRSAGIYVPHKQWPISKISILIKGGKDPYQWVEPLRNSISEIAPTLAMPTTCLSIQKRLDEENSLFVLVIYLLISFGIAGTFKALVGLYAIISIYIKERKREIGVRIALGAKSSNILEHVFRESRWYVGVGVAMGLLCGLGLFKLLMGGLNFPSDYEVPVLPLLCISLGVIGFCAIAIGVPAWRASRLDPLNALRSQ